MEVFLVHSGINQLESSRLCSISRSLNFSVSNARARSSIITNTVPC